MRMNIDYIRIGPDLYRDTRELASRIWNECYADIISQSQIDYMLGSGYSAEAIDRDIRSGVIWELVRADTSNVGLISYVAQPELVFLRKVYFTSQSRGRGLFPDSLRRIVAYAESRGLDLIKLTVNKRNARAIRAYHKNGFTLVAEAVTDIGSGYVMDDYIMHRRLG